MAARPRKVCKSEGSGDGGDTFRLTGVSAFSIKQEAIGIRKYKEILMNVVKDALEIMGYGSAEKIESEIFGIITKRPKRKKDVSLDDNIHQQQRQH